MDIKQLYTVFTQKVSAVAAEKNGADSIEELQKLLQDNTKLFEEQKSKRAFFLLFFLVLGLVVGMFVSKMLFEFPQELVFLCAAASALIFFLFAYFTNELFSYRVFIEVIFLKKVLQRGWRMEFGSPKYLWSKYQADYFFLNKGDTCDEVHCVVHGKTDSSYDFTYFDYFYTIEIEEEVQKEDSNGDVYYVTEYHEESYTQTCFLIKKESDLPLMTINGALKGIKPLKFSNIQLNHQAKVYTKEPQKAFAFFSPLTQLVFSDFYKHFPSATIQIDKRGIFINFCSDFTNVAHTVPFDDSLVQKMDSSYLVKQVEKIVTFVCGELMDSFGNNTITQRKKKELENA